MKEKISTVIIDDERLAREDLRYLLKSFPEVEIDGEAKNFSEGLEKIKLLHPELLFLDINLPGKNGFELLQELIEIPRVIFVTAYDKYAVKAFEENALDYIVKPVKPERLAKAIAKVKREIQSRESSFSEMDRQIFLKDGDKCYFIKMGEIFLIESVGNYSKFYFDKRFCVMHRSLKRVEKEFPSKLFFRANRLQIVNLNFITHIESFRKGGMRVRLQNNVEVKISNRNSVAFKNRSGL